MARSARDIAGYRLVAGLGEGGMARVYLALSRKAAGFSKLVVLKVLRSSTAGDADLRRMFFDEARIAALLNHPNVVQTYEAGDDEGRLFLAMEYLEGKSLSALIAARAPRELPLDVHLRILADMLEGLHYAHDIADVDGAPLEIVHRDVSPQNVLVTFAGQSKVVDFGIAKVAGSPATQSGIIKGKVGYMAPEQIHNKKADRRTDVFSVGVMLWEAIARRRLVQRGEDEIASIARRMSGADPSIRTVAPADAPEELLAICEKAMSHAPDDRHATALELHDALDRYLRKTGGADQKRVAELLESAFGADRKRTRAFVEEQMRNADDSSPLIDVSRPSMARVAAPLDAPDVARGGVTTTTPIGDARSLLPNVPVLPGAPPSVPELHQERRSSATSAPQVADVAPPGARSTSAVPASALVAFVVIAIAVAAFGVILIVASRSGAPKVLATAPPAAPATGSAATDAGATVRLAVQTNAESATLVIDDEPQTLPFQGRIARGASVRVSARAPGFVDYDRVLTLDEDTNLDIALSRAPATGATAATPSTAATGAGPSPAATSSNGRSAAAAAADRERGRKKRAIDDGDPYRR